MTEETTTTNRSAHTSRRAFIRSAAAVAALGTMPAMATAGDDAELIAMGEEFDARHAETERLNAELQALNDEVEDRLFQLSQGDIKIYLADLGRVQDEVGFTKPANRVWELLAEKDALGERIMAMPAHTVRGLATQARVVMAFPDETLEKALQTGEAFDYVTVLVAKLLQSIEVAANA